MLNTIIIVVAFISLIIQLNGISEAFTNRPEVIYDDRCLSPNQTLYDTSRTLLCTGPGEATQIN